MTDILIVLAIALQIGAIVGSVFLIRLVNQQHGRLKTAKLQIRGLVSEQRIKIRTLNSVLQTLINWTVLSVIPKTYRVPLGAAHQVLRHIK
jgi:hypothetical protein